MKKIIIHDFAGHPFAFELSKELSKKYKIYHLFLKMIMVLKLILEIL